MRDFVHIAGLFLLFAVLVAHYPTMDVGAPNDGTDVAAFASFITLSPAAHAIYIEAARTSWQVRNEARVTPSIGRLDSDIPMLSDVLPPLSKPDLSVPAQDGPILPPPDPDVYSLIPPTMGSDVPAFAVRVLQAETDHPPEEPAAKTVFGRADMLSTNNSRILKEIMQ